MNPPIDVDAAEPRRTQRHATETRRGRYRRHESSVVGKTFRAARLALLTTAPDCWVVDETPTFRLEYEQGR
jgi:hypothetical protein